MQPKQLEIILDTWKLIPQGLNGRRRSCYVWPFVLRQDGIHLVPKARARRLATKKKGSLKFHLNWCVTDQEPVNGFIRIAHPDWQCPPLVVALVGIPTGVTDDRDWRLLCPLTANLEQVLLFDPENRLFVSRAAVGRKQAASIGTKFSDSFLMAEDLRERISQGFQKPPGMPDDIFQGLTKAAPLALARLQLDMEWAASGIAELKLDKDGYIDVLAMARPSSLSKVGSSAMFQLDKNGTLAMTPKAKKLVGIF
jgi:hypothetical protein